MLTFLTDESHRFLGAVQGFPHPRIFTRYSHTHIVGVTRLTTLPLTESYLCYKVTIRDNPRDLFFTSDILTDLIGLYEETHTYTNTSSTSSSAIAEKPRCRVDQFWRKVEDHVLQKLNVYLQPEIVNGKLAMRHTIDL